MLVHGHAGLFATLWTAALQAPLSMGFSRQEYWSGLPFPPSEDLPDPGIEPRSLALQADSLPSEPPGKSAILYYHSMIALHIDASPCVRLSQHG